MIRTLLVVTAVAGSLALVACESTPSTESEPTTTQPGTASMGAINDTCPMMGEPVDPNARTASFRGHTIGFCCDGCAGPWEAKSDDEKAAYVASQTH